MADKLDDIIVETILLGGVQRVTALDPATLIEIVFQAPANADRSAILQLARQKLAWRIAREDKSDPPAGGRGGTLA